MVKLKDEEKLAIIEKRQQYIYQTLVEDYGNNYISVHWDSKESQQKRFEQFLKIGDLNGKSILDVGCGLGDFFVFLKKNGIDCKCTGFDIVPGLLDIAKENYPDANYRLVNLALTPLKEKFDYVFASGIFAFGDLVFFKKMMKQIFNASKNASAINIFLTKESNFFCLPSKIVVPYCKANFTDKVDLIDDYLNDDYTLFLRH